MLVSVVVSLCDVVHNLLSDYFSGILQTDNLWDNSWQILGAPATFSLEQAFYLNIKILTTNFYIFNCRKLRKLPNRADLDYHLSYYEEIYNFSNRYQVAKSAWVNRRTF